MTAAVAREATAADHGLLAEYVVRCRELGVSDRALRDRLRAARSFLRAHPDLDAWMGRSTEHRLVDLARTKAWPLLVFAIGTGRLRLDMELAGAKNLTGLGRIVEDHTRRASRRPARPAYGWVGRRAGLRPCCTSVSLSCSPGPVGPSLS